MAFLLILITSIALSLSNYDSFQLGSYMDDASYAVLAKSIVHSNTYGLINTPVQPASTRYPFGFPLILSVFVLLYPSAIRMLKVASLLATILNMVLIFWGWPYISQHRSRWWGLIIAALYAVSPLVIGHSKMVMSEPAFTTLVLLTLILAEKFLPRKEAQFIPTFLTGMIMMFAVFTRTIGVILTIAIVIRILMLPLDKSIKQRKLFYILLGGIVFIALVVALTPVTLKSLLPNEYMNQLTAPHEWGQSRIENAFLPRIFGAFKEYLSSHLRLAIIPMGGGASELELGKRFGIPNLPFITGLLIGCFILLGSFSVFQKQGLFPTVLIFEVLYFTVILLWPWRDARFLYPILLFLLYDFLWGIRILAKQLNRLRFISGRMSIFIADAGLAIVILAIFSVSLYKGISNHDNDLQYVRDLRVGTRWLKENTSSDAIVMAQQSQGIYLYSERKTVDFPFEGNHPSKGQFENILRTQGVNYILVAPEMAWHQDGSLSYDQFTSETMLPLLDELKQQNIVKVVYASDADMVVIYQFLNR